LSEWTPCASDIYGILFTSDIYGILFTTLLLLVFNRRASLALFLSKLQILCIFCHFLVHEKFILTVWPKYSCSIQEYFAQISSQCPAYRVEISEKYVKISCRNIGRARWSVVPNIREVSCHIVPKITVQYREISCQNIHRAPRTEHHNTRRLSRHIVSKINRAHRPILGKCM